MEVNDQQIEVIADGERAIEHETVIADGEK